MYCILSPDIALRSWQEYPEAYWVRGKLPIQIPVKEEFERLQMADGTTEMPEDMLQAQLLLSGLISPCEKGSKCLSEWQKLKMYTSHFMPCISIQITGRCNYNCRHCFNAVDNAALNDELSYGQVCKLLDDAVGCGIHGVLLTGGEPLIHKDFFRILDAIYERNMCFFELLTNGAKVDEKLMYALKERSMNPVIKISFDGIRVHDWMRGMKGAEEKTLQAIRLCVAHGFRVMVQMNINRKTLSAVPETLDMLDRMGVVKCRLIRTTETPRWLENAEDDTIGIRDYYEAGVSTAESYSKNEHKMLVTVWRFFDLDPVKKEFQISGIHGGAGMLQPEEFSCDLIRKVMSIGANGNVYPCFAMSGGLEERGMYLGNIRKEGLKALLTDSPYYQAITICNRDRYEESERCRSCVYFRYCGSGCPALSLTKPESRCNMKSYDPMRCVLFENRYDLRLQEAMPSYQNKKPIVL